MATILADDQLRNQVVAGNDGSELVVGFPVNDVALRQTAAVVEVSEPMTPIDSVLSGDVEKLAIGGGAVLLLVLLLGLVLTGRALRPLRRLTATAGQLAAGDLRARSRLVPRDDEVGQLASAFDHMADRIEFGLRCPERVRRRRSGASSRMLHTSCAPR